MLGLFRDKRPVESRDESDAMLCHTERRITESLVNIKNLKRRLDDLLEEERQLKKKRIEVYDVPWDLCSRAEFAYMSGLTPIEQCEYPENPFLSLPNEIIHLIIANLFKTQLFFIAPWNGEPKTMTWKYYKPSYWNHLSMKDLANFLQTCRYINNTVGSVIRSHKPPRTGSHCNRCRRVYHHCKDCHLSYCRFCSHDHMIKIDCPKCKKRHSMCPCQSHVIKYPGIECVGCHANMTNIPYTT